MRHGSAGNGQHTWGARDSMLAMVFTLATSAAQGWRRLNGAERLADILTGLQFKGGGKVKGQRIAA
ncbi:MAG TPA: hypothetical protein PKD12_01035 [Nitrospira sp.]|nr:hypothetical protein [Nitrospira sp.]